MKAFICHYSPLTARKAYLEEMLPKLGFNEIEWVTERNIIDYDINKVYDPSTKALELRNSTSFGNFGMKHQKPLNNAIIEVTLQHFECYKRIVEQKLDKAVIFEDDVIFKKNFDRLFDQYIKELPSSFDVLYFGKGCGHHHSPMTLIERIQNILGQKHLFRNVECRSRFSDSYLISYAAADNFLRNCFPFHLPIDWELNYLQSSLDMEIYWAEPTLTFQGSKYGYYKSNLKTQIA